MVVVVVVVVVRKEEGVVVEMLGVGMMIKMMYCY